MIRLICYEILKLINRKSFWVVFLTILLSNSFLLFLIKNVNDPDSTIVNYHISIREEMNDLTIEESKQYLEEELSFYENAYEYDRAISDPEYFEMPSISDEEKKRYESIKYDFSYMYERKEIVEELYSYYTNIETYSKYLTSIKKNVSKLSNSPMWLMMSDTEKDDIYAHASTYEKLEDLDIQAISYLSIETYSNSMIARLMSFIMVCIIAIFILKEDEEVMSELLSSTPNGHRRNAFIKICSFLIMSFITVVCIQLLDFGIHLLLYGPVDFNAPIQSMPSLYESPEMMRIGSWIVISMLVFAVCISLFCMLFLFLYHICKNKILSFILFFVFFAIEAIFYTIIPESSFFVPLSHVNILRLFEGCMIGRFLSYQHFLFIRIPSYVSMPLLCVVIGGICSIIYIYLYNQKIGKKRNGLSSYIVKSPSLVVQEANRILQQNKAILIMILVVAISLGNYVFKMNENKAISQREGVIYSIYEQYEGFLTEEKEERINSIAISFENIEKNYMNAKDQYKQKEITYQELQNKKNIYEESIFEKNIYNKIYSFINREYEYIVYNNGFNYIFAILSDNQDLLIVSFIIFVLTLIGSCIMFRNNEEKLYITTYNGVTKLKKIMLLEIFILMLIIFIFIEIYTYFYITKLYPARDFNVSMDLLYQIEGKKTPIYFNGINAREYICLLIGVRFFSFVSIYLIITLIFSYCKNKIVGIIISFLFFFLPMFLFYNGQTLIIHFSLFDIMMGNMFLKTSFSLTKLVNYIIIDVICISIIKKSIV